MAIVLITGCSSGFGKLAAVEFARRGDTVFASMRDTAKAGPLRAAAKAAGVAAEVVALDVNDSASVNAAVADVVKRGGRIDVLVNNAGIGTHGPVEDYDDDEVQRVFDTNVTGLMRVTRAVLPQMRAQGGGTIVNVGSLAGKVTAPFSGVYSASKHAVESLSDALHFELQQFGIRVALIEPGGFQTEFGANRHIARRFGEGSPYAAEEQRFAAALTRLPGRPDGGLADPQDVANAIVDATKTEEPKRRYLVGQDAQTIGGLHKQLSDEDFEKTIRQALDWQ
jgi:NAD(P)-dependent dehydrogenase (short-subunit alcohol dehydrogenase family)